MPIPLNCACGRSLRVKDELAGRRVKCPQCGEALPVPGLAADKEELGLLPQDDPWKEAPQRSAESRPAPADDEAVSEVLPVDPDEGEEDEDDDEPSMREAVRRKERRGAEREAERQAEQRRKRRREKRYRELAEKGRFGIQGSGRRHPFEGGWLYNANAGIVAGAAMIVISLVCSGLALRFRGPFYFMPILLIVGVVAIIKGILDNNKKQ